MTRLRRLVAPALTRCVGRPGHRDASTRAPEDGFTLIEVIVAFTLAAIVFTALAIAMAGGMKAVRVAKDRTRGNELATAAIEDLQRFDSDHLGLCPPSAIVLNADGTNQNQINLSASTSGLAPTDTVTASLLTLNGGTPANTSIALTSADGIFWSGSIASGAYTFGAGSQYIVFSELRA